MKITNDEYRQYIKDQYIRAYVEYQAMKILAKEQGVDTDDVPTPTPTPAPTSEATPTSTSTPSSEPTPTPTSDPEPSSKDPEIVYNGSSTITLARGESTSFKVYINNVGSANDYIINTSGEPTYYSCNENGVKTTTGYRLDFNLRGVNYGKGGIKVYLAKDRTKYIIINVIVK